MIQSTCLWRVKQIAINLLMHDWTGYQRRYLGTWMISRIAVIIELHLLSGIPLHIKLCSTDRT